jgi:ATP-binding cassette subfamily B protein
MERAAFARARSFLNYHPVAKYTSLAAAIGTSVLYVALLMLLGLFADLIVNRGQIPAFSSLSANDRAAFRKEWEDPLPHMQPYDEGSPIERDSATVKKAREEVQKLFKDKDLRWDDKDDAKIKPAIQLRLTLSDLGFKDGPEDLNLHTAMLLCLRNPSTLKEHEKETRLQLLWMVHLHQFLAHRVGDSAAALLSERFVETVKHSSPIIALNRDIHDVGLLSMVVRTQHRPLGFDNWILGLAARFNPWLWKYGPHWNLFGLMVLAMLVAAARSVLSFVAQFTAAQAVIGATTRLRRAVYHHTYRLGTLAFRALGPSEAISVSTRHLEVVHDGLFTWLTVRVSEPIKFGLVLVFALFVNFWLALAFLLFAVLVWISGGQVAAYFRRLGRAASHHAAEQLVLIQESLSMMRLVKVYLMEVFNQARVERQLSKFAESQTRRHLGEAISRPVLVLLATIAGLILLFLTGWVLVEGSLGASAASAVTLATALVSLYWPVSRWLDSRRVMRRAYESAMVLFKFLDRSGGVGQVVEAEFLQPLSKQLEFDNVSLNEPGTGRKLLQGVTLTIQAGQRVALVGPDDMQKRALVYLISRFLDPTDGEIRIDRKNLRWVTFDSLRTHIAMVLQHNLVFNDTIANNIGCGDPSFTLQRIMEAAKVAHAHHFIQKLPQGYETPIGEMGHSLTIGEKFRIALARAILRDPPLLIVEEPAQPLDEDTKSLLDDTLARVLPGRTAIFLPHRLSTIRNCDKVFLLYEGRIAAAGDHKELLASSDLYRHLQYLEFNEFAGLVNVQPAAVAEESAGS